MYAIDAVFRPLPKRRGCQHVGLPGGALKLRPAHASFPTPSQPRPNLLRSLTCVTFNTFATCCAVLTLSHRARDQPQCAGPATPAPGLACIMSACVCGRHDRASNRPSSSLLLTILECALLAMITEPEWSDCSRAANSRRLSCVGRTVFAQVVDGLPHSRATLADSSAARMSNTRARSVERART